MNATEVAAVSRRLSRDAKRTHSGNCDYKRRNYAQDQQEDRDLCGTPSLDYSGFCQRKKKRCSKRLMNTGFSRTQHSLSEHPKRDISLYTTLILWA
jgi:hypothetical protein